MNSSAFTKRTILLAIVALAAGGASAETLKTRTKSNQCNERTAVEAIAPSEAASCVSSDSSPASGEKKHVSNIKWTPGKAAQPSADHAINTEGTGSTPARDTTPRDASSGRAVRKKGVEARESATRGKRTATTQSTSEGNQARFKQKSWLTANFRQASSNPDQGSSPGNVGAEAGLTKVRTKSNQANERPSAETPDAAAKSPKAAMGKGTYDWIKASLDKSQPRPDAQAATTY